ncbi:MAG: hypothetical protein MJ234_02860 [bacterium]|nr:hypothetical protein [bacterium]
MQSVKSTSAAAPSLPAASMAPKMPSAPKMPQAAGRPGMPLGFQQGMMQNGTVARPSVMPFNNRPGQMPQTGRTPAQTQQAQQPQSPFVTNKGMQQLAKMNAQYTTSSVSLYENSSAASTRKAPEYPEAAFERLNNMMQNNKQTRNEASQRLNRQLSDMKEQFFENYSYKTEKGEDGKPRVKTDEQGRPQLQNGKETFEQRVARQQFEASTQKSSSQYFANVKENFLANEKQQVMQFLQNHRNELANPAVQQELQQMLTESEKKALKLKRDIDAQMLEMDLPTEDMRKHARTEKKKLDKMEDDHKQMEDSSAEAHELIMYQEEMNVYAMEEKKKLQFAEKDESFLQNPNEFLKPHEAKLSDLLPPYLVTSLYNMGIYAIE